MTNTISAERRSGIHKVAIELARNLGRHTHLDIVKWDDQDGQLRFADYNDMERLFGPNGPPPGVAVRNTANKVRYRFGDLLETDRDWWLLNPEIAYHSANGNEFLARMTSQCREYRVRSAAIFYDLIPIENQHYSDYRSQHIGYLSELVRADIILPISTYSGDSLKGFYRAVASKVDIPLIRPLLLPELQAGEVPNIRDHGHIKDTIMVVGTVEPRKRQIEFLQAFAHARTCSEAVAGLKLFFAGSLHALVADEFRRAIDNLPGAIYADYAPQSVIDEHYRRAIFSAFPSNDEGYGLPIAESLAHGVPCLCANFGSMAEIAQGGGCLTVDVNSLEAMKVAIIALAEDRWLRDTLTGQIARRRFRNWSDYAREVVGALIAAPRPGSIEVDVKIVDPGAVAGSSDQVFCEWASADVLAFSEVADSDEFIVEAVRRDCPILLPTRIVMSDSNSIQTTAAAAAADLSMSKARSLKIAQTESTYSKFRRHFSAHTESKDRFLRIILSTYNRAPFVRENVRWLLSTIAKTGSDIQVVVVDNASTDDTICQLVEFVGHSNYILTSNTSNTGMLGNLKICAEMAGAEYTWVIGDDDFIVADEFQSILAALQKNIGIPVACCNFGVYHRSAMGAFDNAEVFISERTPLNRSPTESGLYKLSRIAVEHDNMFTAIYPIIWRSDILSTCFNYPFTGRPFSNLIESVPTTKLLLESYGDTEVYWHKTIGIVGNAHNSWSRHRPRWHAFLMPKVFELAREAGVDRQKLFQWSKIHRDLFYDAIEIANAERWNVELDHEELQVSWRVFREKIILPYIGKSK